MSKEVKKDSSASVFQVAKAVFGAFTGIRKKSDHEADFERLKPVQVIIGGLIGGVLFVLTVLFLVRMVTS
ncbi:MAG: DUF2970 domain-containing protein [Nitrosomonas sp.]|nr:DUF2970 domain-containing protein [Nitrosomonas sp.]MDP1950913.1 DUF2970 domain-containing protein [Nitrosomonas sp.]